jgi:hypothetical protein
VDVIQVSPSAATRGVSNTRNLLVFLAFGLHAILSQ